MRKSVRYKGALTTKDTAVVLSCIIFLFATLGAVGSVGRERAKRTVCLSNLKQLTAAWNLYTDENNDRIVNGEAYLDPIGPPAAPVPTSGIHKGERYWTGNDCASNFMLGEQRPQYIQIQAIRAGALYPYCGTEKLYRCPAGIRGQMRTYSIADSMNGMPREGTISGNVGVRVGNTVLWVKKRSEITIPPPASRTVFIDVGRILPDSYAVHYLWPRWWDPPPVRHNDGATLSFADGHTEYWKWKGRDTIAAGKMTNPMHQFQPVTAAGREDLQRMQKAVWGRLSYTP
jgi:prepilin-type processing-associated H-X9-DG protein